MKRDDETWYERHAGNHWAVGRLRAGLDGEVSQAAAC